MNYTEAVNYIHSLLKFGIRPGLSGMGALLRFLDDPQKGLRFVHIAGTNGKGSTSTAISNVMCEAGYKTGLYTSPYVSEFLERVQVNGAPVDKNIFAESVEKVKSAVVKLLEDGIVITEFEALTAAAFMCFKLCECEIVILEVGLGGRLDATNVIENPLVNVITSLSLDHTAILGNTIEKIAFEKCGTIKENGHTVCSYGQPDGALNVIKETAKDKNNTLVIPDEKNISVLKSDIFGTDFIYKNIVYSIPMAGEHQLKNMTCAIEACGILKSNFNISDEDIRNGIAKTVLPARVEVLCRKPLVILDGGHNEDGARAFYKAVAPQIEKCERVIVVAGMMADKAVEASLTPLMKKTDVFFAVTPENPRAMKASVLAGIAKKYVSEVHCIDSVKDAVDSALENTDENSAVLVVGSLYLAGEVRNYLIEKIKNFD